MVRRFAVTGGPVRINGGVTEYAFEGKLAADPELKLRVEFQVNDNTPVIRFRYLLTRACFINGLTGQPASLRG